MVDPNAIATQTKTAISKVKNMPLHTEKKSLYFLDKLKMIVIFFILICFCNSCKNYSLRSNQNDNGNFTYMNTFEELRSNLLILNDELPDELSCKKISMVKDQIKAIVLKIYNTPKNRQLISSFFSLINLEPECFSASDYYVIWLGAPLFRNKDILSTIPNEFFERLRYKIDHKNDSKLPTQIKDEITQMAKEILILKTTFYPLTPGQKH